VSFFETPMVKYQLDAILSINNNNAGHAAVQLPLPYDPYGVQNNGEPWDLFIARPYQEDALLKWVLPLKSKQTLENYPTINRFKTLKK
jgi:amidase